MAAEMLRVTRPGGLVFISYTTWWGPWGGHETAPWHYLGGRQARRRYAGATVTSPRTSSVSPSSRSRSPTACAGSRSQQDADVVHVLPRYNPWWSRWLLHVPVVREVVTWNLVLVLRKR